MDPESIEVTSSGSIETEPIVETPSPAPIEPVAPTVDPKEPVTPPTEPTGEVELFELPDGRKVDAVTLSKEWKENFYPDYTRKSQALAAKDTQPITTPAPEVPATDEWVPQTWSEVLQKAKEEMKQDQIREQQEAQQQAQAIEQGVIEQLTAVKTLDPNVNENALFQHALKYKFTDLRLAHQNMQDMASVIKTTQQVTAKNVQKRNDPVSGTPSATGGNLNPTHFQSATEYLRALNK